MKEAKCIRLIRLLAKDDYFTAEEIANELGISSRTVQNIIKEVNESNEISGIEIISRKGRGYRLSILDYNKYLEHFNKVNDSIPTYPTERIHFILWHLLSNEYVKLIEISKRLYVSQATLTNDIKEVSAKLNRYGLTIERKPYYGLRVVGDEFDKRMCLCDSINDGFCYNDIDISVRLSTKQHLRDIVKDNLKKHNLKISSISLNDLVNYLYISIHRFKNHYYIDGSKSPETYNDNQKYILIASDIISQIKDDYHLEIPLSEKHYLKILLIAKETFTRERGDLLFDSTVFDIATDMINSVYEAFNVNLTNDFDLKLALVQHLIPLQVRIKCGISTENPILDEIRREYPLANAMASYASNVIQKHYNQILSEDEIGYIALAFALSMEKTQTQSNKWNICLVSAYGRMNSKLFEYQIQDNVGSYIDKLYSIDINDLDAFNYNQVDYVFTTVPINIDLPVPVVQVASLNMNDQVEFIRKIFKKRVSSSMLSFFDESLFYFEENNNKNAILQNMCNMIEEKTGSIGLYEAVIRREKVGNTVFCDDVAMSHPDKILTEKPYICISVLKEPVLWENDKRVRVVFLVCISKNKEHNLASMYRYLAKIVMNKKYIDHLVKEPYYSTLVEIIDEINNIK